MSGRQAGRAGPLGACALALLGCGAPDIIAVELSTGGMTSSAGGVEGSSGGDDLGGAEAEPECWRYPDAAGVVDVTAAPYGAVGDGIADDTAALQAAIADRPNERRTVFIPPGTYRVSGPIAWSVGDTQAGFLTLQGACSAQTRIVLDDGAPGFDDPERPQPVLNTHAFSSKGRYNEVRGLTIDVGAGNPGASGLHFVSAVEGEVDDVVVVAAADSGATGIGLTASPGKGSELLRRVRVRGFDVGVRIGAPPNVVTLDDVVLEDQRTAAIVNDGAAVALSRIRAEGPAAVVINGPAGGGSLAIRDSEFLARGAVPAAIVNSGFMVAHNIAAIGYERAIRADGQADGQADPAGPAVEQYVSHPPISLFGAEPFAPDPMPPVPSIPLEPAEAWVNIEQYGADPTGEQDSTAAVQAAIDAGARTLLVPPGGFRVDEELRLRGAVERVIGPSGSLRGSGVLLVEDGPPVILESLNVRIELELTHPRAVVLRRAGDIPRVTLTGAAELHAIALRLGTLTVTHPEARVWARSLNPSSGEPIRIERGRLVVLGLVGSTPGTLLSLADGAAGHIFGGQQHVSGVHDTSPVIFELVDAESWIGGFVEHGNAGHPTLIEETQSAEASVLSPADAPAREAVAALPLFVGRP